MHNYCLIYAPSTRIRFAKSTTIHCAHKLDPGPKSSMLFRWHSPFKPATSPLVQKNNSIPYTTASHFTMPRECKTCLRHMLIYGQGEIPPIKDGTQANVIFHATFRSCEIGMTLSILSFIQAKSSCSNTDHKALLPETHLSRGHRQADLPGCCMAAQHFSSLSTGAATALCTLLAAPLACSG